MTCDKRLPDLTFGMNDSVGLVCSLRICISVSLQVPPLLLVQSRHCTPRTSTFEGFSSISDNIINLMRVRTCLPRHCLPPKVFTPVGNDSSVGQGQDMYSSVISVSLANVSTYEDAQEIGFVIVAEVYEELYNIALQTGELPLQNNHSNQQYKLSLRVFIFALYILETNYKKWQMSVCLEVYNLGQNSFLYIDFFLQ